MEISKHIEDYLEDLRDRTPSARSIESQLRPVLRLLGNLEAEELRGREIREYRRRRRQERTNRGAAPAQSTINRELTYLRAALRSAWRQEVLPREPPYFPMVKESAATRTEFPSEKDFLEIFGYLSARDPDVADLVEGYWLTGWRLRELSELSWLEVDLGERLPALRLPAERNKGRRERVLPLHGELLDLMRRRLTRRYLVCSWVFHRRGEPIRSFRKIWKSATRHAGRPDLKIHSFRRALARRHLLAGVSREATMNAAGWETPSIYKRYAILHEADMLRELRKADTTA